ncbi:hypothetical protein [Kitasatospora sp. NPDC054795]
MDLSAELTTLAAAGAARLVEAIVTDTWPAVRSGVLSLWRRAHPERVAADLDDTREELLTAQGAGAPGDLQALLVNEWQAKLARLLHSHPDLADELRELIAGVLTARRPDAPPAGSVTITTRVTDGDAYVAGRDLTVHRPAAE